ncbi:restriction endonuclease [Vibrio vulnificus]|uniref:restriction endonuclease n=1 Tax=Vibrio vulnificus TaxID=672 RepID=UPI003EDAEB8A
MKICETSEDYEILAQKIYEDILALEGADNIKVQHNVKVKGISGVDHQIDVFWEYRYAGIVHRVLIECKHYSHSVSLLHVRNMHGLLNDIPNSSGVIVTTKDYQSGAKKYAEFYNIGVKLIRKPEGKDWDGCIQIIAGEVVVYSNDFLELSFGFDGSDTETSNIISDDPSVINFNVSLALVCLLGESPEPINVWLSKQLPINRSHIGQEFNEVIKPQDTYLIISGDRKLKLAEVKVCYKTLVLKNNFNIDAMNFVEAVLQDCSSGNIEHMRTKNA